uniref:Uncharacterized protein n=1 Tax=viral metagenome TaxID=1070528 RepID=A0A6M3Y546_9ZZZZ
MILQLHQPDGVATVDTATVTDDEWLALGMTLEQLADYRAKDASQALLAQFTPGLPFAQSGMPQALAETRDRVVALEKVVSALIKLR